MLFKLSHMDIQIVAAEITMQQLLLQNSCILHMLCCFERENDMLCLGGLTVRNVQKL